MASVVYATREDVYRVGLPRGSLASESRLISSADPATSRLELEGHGFSASSPVQFQIDTGGVLPAPLALLTVYYVVLVPVGGDYSESLFQVSATSGGAAITLTTTGTAPFRGFVPFGLSIDRENENHSRWIDSLLPGEAAPLTAPFPAWVVDTVAKRTAASLVRQLGLGSFQGVIDEADSVTRDALRLAKNGIRIRDGGAGAIIPTNLAVVASRMGTQTRNPWEPAPAATSGAINLGNFSQRTGTGRSLP